MFDLKRIKSEAFAVRIVKLNEYLIKKKEFHISDQIVRSGTSVGANVAESLYAESDNDLIHKLSVSLKEASETRFWLNVLYQGKYIGEKLHHSLLEDCEELIRILVAIRNSVKKKGKFRQGK